MSDRRPDDVCVERIPIRMSDGYDVIVARYRPTSSARGVIVANHGIQSHAGWFTRTSSDWAAAGLDVWFIDRRGSGQNRDQRGHARGGGRLVEDTRQVVIAALRNSPDLPLVLTGICWGGKIAAAAAADPRVPNDALMLLYPGLYQRIRGTIRNRFRLHTGRFLGASKRLVPLPLPESLFTSDPHWQQFIRDDELTLREISVGSLFAARDLDRMRQPKQVTCPTLVQLAANDAIVDNDRVTKWALKTAGKSLVHRYGNVDHVIEFSSAREQAVQDTLKWFESLLGESRAAVNVKE